MNPIRRPKLDPKLDLVLERVVDVSPELVWAAWTKPEYLMKWFCPAPWSVSACELDVRPGGIFSTTMRSPTGDEFPNVGCYLEVIENQKLVWTDALHAGFRPAPRPQGDPSESISMTGMLLLEREGSGTRYTAIALHADERTRMKHEAMGFQEGWGAALEQLIALAKTLRS